MRLTGKNRGVDSALPQYWLDKMSKEMMVDYDAARIWYAWDYQGNSGGVPVHLGEKFIQLLDEKQVEVKLKGYEGIHKISINQLVQRILEQTDNIEIIIH